LDSVTNACLAPVSSLAPVSAGVSPVAETALPSWIGRGGNAAAVDFGAQFQAPEAETEQSYCSAATTKGLAKGCRASKLPVINNGNFLRNAGDFNAILIVRASCVPSARGVGRTPLDGLKKMLDNKA
jgi:hypothetical protein